MNYFRVNVHLVMHTVGCARMRLQGVITKFSLLENQKTTLTPYDNKDTLKVFLRTC
jgi:hypothetical protein